MPRAGLVGGLGGGKPGRGGSSRGAGAGGRQRPVLRLSHRGEGETDGGGGGVRTDDRRGRRRSGPRPALRARGSHRRLRLRSHSRDGGGRAGARPRLHDARARARDAAGARALPARRHQGDAHAGARRAPAGRDRIMTAEQFVAELDAQNQSLLSRLAPDDTRRPEVEGDLNVPNLLRVALRNALEATEIAARWLVTTDAVDVKLALARQVGDEAKHYRMIAERPRALGGDARSFYPLAQGRGPLFPYLDKLTSPVERVAAGQLTREAIAGVTNRQFLGFCEAAGGAETAALYRDAI